MKKNWKIAVILMALVVPLLTGAFVVAMFSITGETFGKEAKEEKDFTMFSAYTTVETLQTVPYMQTKGTVENPENYGNYKGYLVNVKGSTVEEYQTYLKTLEEKGFKKHSDNGEDAMEGNIMTASFTKDELTLTVSHAIKRDHTYISVANNVPLSDHLIYKDEYVEGISEDAQTKVHMTELWNNGNSFVIQLKNGHFIIEDGAKKQDAPYLLDYLESLVPEGEKPVIEAWFISHPHEDHSGAMTKIATTKEYQDRIYVEGFYYYDMSDVMLTFLTLQSGVAVSRDIRLYRQAFKTTSGETTPLYRPQLGQRYYFCDIQIDVALTIEQCSKDTLENKDLNDSSTWLMHHIEGQRMLIAGDSNYSSQNNAIFLYDKDYFELELFATPHHAINMYDEFADVLDVDTMLYTSYWAGSIWRDGTWKEALSVNARMRDEVEEYLHYGDGGVVMTFPYSVGKAEILPKNRWIYNGGMDGRKNWD